MFNIFKKLKSYNLILVSKNKTSLKKISINILKNCRVVFLDLSINGDQLKDKIENVLYPKENIYAAIHCASILPTKNELNEVTYNEFLREYSVSSYTIIQLSQLLIDNVKNQGRLYYDGPRFLGYGGYNKNDCHWINIAEELIKIFKLEDSMSVLDIGCAKGYLVEAFSNLNFEKTYGIDTSSYAINTSETNIKDRLIESSVPFVSAPSACSVLVGLGFDRLGDDRTHPCLNIRSSSSASFQINFAMINTPFIVCY